MADRMRQRARPEAAEALVALALEVASRETMIRGERRPMRCAKEQRC